MAFLLSHSHSSILGGMTMELMSTTCDTLALPVIDLSSSKAHCENVRFASNELIWLQSIRLQIILLLR